MDRVARHPEPLIMARPLCGMLNDDEVAPVMGGRYVERSDG